MVLAKTTYNVPFYSWSYETHKFEAVLNNFQLLDVQTDYKTSKIGGLGVVATRDLFNGISIFISVCSKLCEIKSHLTRLSSRV